MRWIGLVVACLSAQESFRDLLHGYEVRLPEGFSVFCSQGLAVLTKKHLYVAMGAAKASQGLPAVTQEVLRQLRHVGGSKARFYTRQTPRGLEILGEGLAYPFFLRPIVAVSPEPLPERYRFLGTLFPGQSSVVLTFFWIPEEGEGAEALEEAREAVASFRFLPASQRVPYKEVTLPDPQLGVPFGALHIPTTTTVQGGPFRQGEKYFYRYEVRDGASFYRTDFLDIHTSVVMGSGTSMLIYNGQSLPLQPLMIQRPEEFYPLLLQIWQQETGQSWEVVQEKSMEASVVSPGVSVPFSMQQQAWTGSLEARSGQRTRLAFYQLTISYGATGMGSGQYTLQAMLRVMEYPTAQKSRYEGIFGGVYASLQPSPEWSLRAYQAYSQTVAENNRRLQEWLRQRRSSSTASGSGESFSSEMARTWSSALSDQTYVRDSETGEVLKVHKKVWDEGGFWKEPTFGGVYGTLERGSWAEEELRQQGWRPLQESLSGTFPQR